MRKYWVLLLIGLLATFSLVGCGREDPYIENENENGSVTFLSAIPSSGSSINSSASIVLIFDGQPENVTASAGIMSVIGNVVTITGPFVGNILLLLVTWQGGAVTLIYFISNV